MRLKPGESLVGMALLQPELAAKVAAAQAATKAAATADSGADSDADSIQPATAAVDADLEAGSSSGAAAAGPWLLLVTAAGYGKRVSLTDVPCRVGRGTAGVIGIKLTPGRFRKPGVVDARGAAT
jgi:hypothetical protein